MENIIEKIKKISKKVISCKIIYYIAIIILFIGTYYMDLKKRLETYDVLNGSELKSFLIIAIITGIISLVLIIFSKKLYEKIKPHLVFLILGLIMGIMYVFIIPLGAQSDEPGHIYRAYQVAQGEIIAPKVKGRFMTQLPKSVIDMTTVTRDDRLSFYKKYYDIKEMMEIPLEEENKVDVQTVGNYLGTSYFPHVIGIKIGMIFNMNPYFSVMLGRITGLICFVLLYALGIKKLPRHKLLATIILLSPVALSYSAAISADGLIIAATFLMVSYVLHYMHTKEKISKKDYVILAILTFILSVSKMAYVPIIVLLAFLPKECFKDDESKKTVVPIYILVGLTCAMWWMNMTKINVTGWDAGETNSWIFKNPFGYLIVLFRTTANFASTYIEDIFAGNFMCHSQAFPYELVPFVYIIITIIAFLSDENKEKTDNMKKTIIVGIVGLVYVMISTAMYLYNTAYKQNLIVGVQGRYFLPLVLLAMFFANKKRINIKEESLTNIALICNYAACLSMMVQFFV